MRTAMDNQIERGGEALRDMLTLIKQPPMPEQIVAFRQWLRRTAKRNGRGIQYAREMTELFERHADHERGRLGLHVPGHSFRQPR